MTHAPVTIHPRSEVEVAILCALPPGGRAVEATTLFIGLYPPAAGLTYGQFWEALMALDRRGLVETAEIEGRGDDPPRVTARCP